MSLLDGLETAVEANIDRQRRKGETLSRLDALLKEHVPRIVGITDHLGYEHFNPTEVDPVRSVGQPFLAEGGGTFAFGIRLYVQPVAIRFHVRVSLPDANTVDFGLIGSDARYTLYVSGGDDESDADTLAEFCKELYDSAVGALRDREVQPETENETAFIDVNEYTPPAT